jgi:hypothetical protein
MCCLKSRIFVDSNYLFSSGFEEEIKQFDFLLFRDKVLSELGLVLEGVDNLGLHIYTEVLSGHSEVSQMFKDLSRNPGVKVNTIERRNSDIGKGLGAFLVTDVFKYVLRKSIDVVLLVAASRTYIGMMGLLDEFGVRPIRVGFGELSLDLDSKAWCTLQVDYPNRNSHATENLRASE